MGDLAPLAAASRRGDVRLRRTVVGLLRSRKRASRILIASGGARYPRSRAARKGVGGRTARSEGALPRSKIAVGSDWRKPRGR